MIICKWYSIILIGLLMLASTIKMFLKEKGVERLANFIGLMLYMPIMIYLLNN